MVPLTLMVLEVVPLTLMVPLDVVTDAEVELVTVVEPLVLLNV